MSRETVWELDAGFATRLNVEDVKHNAIKYYQLNNWGFGWQVLMFFDAVYKRKFSANSDSF